MAIDIGKWKVGYEKQEGVFIESSDFKHDCRLYINGDFGSIDDEKEYAQNIADRLNKTSI